MYDPLSTTFGEEPQPPWPTTPHSPNDPIPNLPRSSSSRPITPTPGGGSQSGLYGKEPQIYGQPEPGLVSPRVTTASNGTSYERREPYLRVRITGLDRNRRDILVKFDAQVRSLAAPSVLRAFTHQISVLIRKTNLSNFTGTTYRNVSRSYYEFQQFYDAIIHNNPQTIIPALPLAQTSAPTDEEDDRLVKIMLQRWLSRICDDPILATEEEVRSFIESDFGYQPTPNTRKKVGGGFSLIKRGVPDEDEELQRARFELTKLEGQFFEAAKAIDKLAKSRKTLAVVRAEMGNKLVSVATAEAHQPLGNAVRKLGRAFHSLADLDQAQSISECVIIGDSLGYQGLNARSAKETLMQRSSVLEEYQAAVKMTISKRRNIERLRASSNIRPEKVDEALEEMEEANKYEQILARRAQGISENLHRALARHKHLVADDVTTALIEHVRSSIMYERQHLRELEALRPDFANAAQKAVPAKPITGPRPAFVPPLEDFSKPPIPRPSSAAPISAPSSRPGFGSALPVSPPMSAHPTSSLPPPGTTATPPSVLIKNSLPPQSPGAGPSTPQKAQSFAPPLINGPPLGGRFVDGTKSMFIKPTQQPSPLSPSPNVNSPLHSSTGSAFQSPLRSSASTTFRAPPATTGAPHPLAGGGGFDPLTGSVPVPNGRIAAAVNGRGGEDLDPLGMVKPAMMSQSVRVTPSRPRLDAREAASKLANMF
ncbi:hypothetical protein EUX98_g5394 [Antrodiella citrinella]|uniref:PX domain-containing protein n=1 Tax=Antrodiella citrinella TaxID=2447956 RepID=A0A4S4MU06_9APHY|nr:hypothetical protein EUX98_g5394 [Antrodiella citrinella]